MLVRFIRKTLGRMPGAKRHFSAAQKKHLRHTGQGRAVAGLSLYQYRACPYCMIVRRAIDHLGLSVELRDIRRNPHDREELNAGGGRQMVPCLRIEEGGETHWMYESRDIIHYLEARFGQRE